jgi:hypothetical protein
VQSLSLGHWRGEGQERPRDQLALSLLYSPHYGPADGGGNCGLRRCRRSCHPPPRLSGGPCVSFPARCPAASHPAPCPPPRTPAGPPRVRSRKQNSSAFQFPVKQRPSPITFPSQPQPRQPFTSIPRLLFLPPQQSPSSPTCPSQPNPDHPPRSPCPRHPPSILLPTQSRH